MGEPHRICVIGGGAAGISAASMAKRTNPDATVICCTAFEDVAYSPCGIPYVLGREIPDFARLFLAGPENYAEAGIDLRRETNVTAIDAANRTLVAGDETLAWDKLIISSGFNYTLPEVPGNDLEGITYVKNIRRGIELDKALDSVKKAVVLEATPLGVEMLAALAQRGIETHLVDENAWLLAQVADPDIAEPVQKSLEEMGCVLHFGVGLKGFVGSGGKLTGVETTEGIIEADLCIISTHKEPETTLGRSMGLKLGSTGGITVNDRMQTTNRMIYAAGDVCSPYQFTHAADFMARAVIQNALFKGNKKSTSLIIPWCTYTSPEIAHVGLYEHQAKEKNIAVETYVQNFHDVDRAILEGEEAGFAKVHVKKGTDKIVGATIVARSAGDLISEITLAMTHGLGLSKIGNTIHPYPTQAEAIRRLGDQYNRTRLTPFVKSIFRRWLTWTR